MIENVHDHRIYKYVVDFENKTLTFFTKLENINTEITFNGLLSHEFVNNIDGCIIFDIEEIKPNVFIEYYGLNNLIERGKFYWPIDFKTESQFKEKLKSKNIKIFAIDSSYGLSGYVFAKELSIINCED